MNSSVFTGFFSITILSLLSLRQIEAAVVFSESMGSVTATTLIPVHEGTNGFDNDSLTFVGTGDVSNLLPSSGYTGASGSANLFLNGGSGRAFLIDGISTLGYHPGTVGISFGAFKSTTTSTMASLVFAFSTDGTATWTTIPIPAQPTGAGTAAWRLISIPTTSIPITGTLALRWINTDGITQYRLDDITLTAVPETGTALLGTMALACLALCRRPERR